MILGDNIVAGDTGASTVADFVSLAALYSFLSLTNDAVAGYGSDGHIILANDHMAEICGLAARQLIGMDVRSLLMYPSGEFAPEGEWPFPLDGTETLLHCRRPSEGSYAPIAVRAMALGEQGSFILVCRNADEVDAGKLRALSRRIEREEGAQAALSTPSGEIEVLRTSSEAMQEAFATPDISQRELWQLLGTNTEDLGQTLFGPVVEELASAVGADLAAIYLEDSGIYHLRAVSGEVGARRIPTHIDHMDATAIEALDRQMLCMVVPEPGLAGVGKQGLVTVGDAYESLSFEMPASDVVPLASHYIVPLRFGTDATALVVVGWLDHHEFDPSEIRVLSLLSQHLGTEVMNGLGTFRTQAADRVEQVMRSVRRSLEEAEDLKKFDYESLFEAIGRAVRGTYVPLVEVPGEGLALKRSDGTPGKAQGELQEILDALIPGPVRVVSARMSPEFGRWLRANGFDSAGALVDVEALGGRRRTFMILRNWNAGPLEGYDVNFLKRCLQDLFEVDHQRQSYQEAAYISQSLQRGMENQLQDVEGITARGIYNSATASAIVGGDFYDLIDLPSHRACIVCGDVAGKGVRAASAASALRTAISAYAWEGLDPAHMARLVNDFFMGFSSLETFASLFIGIVDLERMTLTYCSAGHPPALLLRVDPPSMGLLEVQSGIVGAFREMAFTEASIPLNVGDVLFLYSDGITEARSPSGEFFGEDGLRQTIANASGRSAEELPDIVLDQLYAFTGSSLNDDCTLLAIRFDGLEASPPDRS